MSLARLVITAITVEGRSKSAVARESASPAFGCSSCAPLATGGPGRVRASVAAARRLSRLGFVNPQPQKVPARRGTGSRGPAQRAVAGRHHPLAAGRRHRGHPRMMPPDHSANTP
jgi:hypothetical protein